MQKIKTAVVWLRAEIVALKEEVGKLKEINNPKVKVDCAKSDYNDWRCR